MTNNWTNKIYLFCYGKSFLKTKAIEDQGQKQVDVLENLKPKEQLVNANDYEDKLLH